MKPPGTIVAVGGQSLHVVVEGAGPAVVLVGGLAGNWFDWDAVAALLVRVCTVVRFDRPGFGLSPASGEPPTVRGEADRIGAVLDAVGVRAPATVVGHSMGAWYAEGFARMRPERAAALVLLDASIPARHPASLPRRWRFGLATALAHGAAASGLQRLAGPRVRLFTHGAPDANAVGWIRQTFTDPDYLRSALVENAAYPDLGAELERLRPLGPVPPTLVVAADSGRSPRWVVRQQRLAHRLGARFETLRPARHNMMADRPASVAALIAGMTV
ncbi:alpha/beta fold hydrolase [Rhodococcus sp. NPDC058514]|uniref:alpha/beta fold hydrolase n=1 Tax=unclassified Rhodococcus (in: high G+C Gram-positive bacteria) TaxID=192944 RepID=UPI00364B9E5E